MLVYDVPITSPERGPLDQASGAMRPRNPYPAKFKHMHHVVQTSRTAHGDAAPEHVLRFSGGIEKDPRRYNAPSAAEVAVAIAGEGSLPPNFISVFERPSAEGQGQTHEMSYLSEHVDTLG
eukprot:4944177-Pyramimonas_sp.AAC.1